MLFTGPATVFLFIAFLLIACLCQWIWDCLAALAKRAYRAVAR